MGNCLTGLSQRPQPPQPEPQRPGYLSLQHAAATASARPASRFGGSLPLSRAPSAPVGRERAESAARQARLEKIAEKAKPYGAKNLCAETALNCKVKISPEPDSTEPAVDVACRHFAQMFVEAAGGKRQLMADFTSADRIKERFQSQWGELNAAFESASTRANADSKHVLREDRLGHYLAALAEALGKPAAGQRTEVNCLLSTSGHAMALNMSRKSRDGIDYFSVKFYDPSRTASYKRVEALTADALRDLSLTDMLLSRARRGMYSDGADARATLVAVCLDPNLRPTVDRRITRPSVDAMHLALSDGSVEDLRQMLARIATKKNACSPKAVFRLLQADSVYMSAPGLQLAMDGGHAETVAVFVSAVLGASALTSEQMVELLAAKRSDGVPGLMSALQCGNAEVVKVYTGAVLKAEALTKSQKIDLLSAKRSNGDPGLLFALQCGKPSAVEAYVHAVLTHPEFSNSDKVELLAAENSDGDSALLFALQAGNAKGVGAFARAVLAPSSLAHTQQFQLLAAETSTGVPGLSLALEAGKAGAVWAYACAVVEATGLTRRQKVALLSAKDSAGETGLYTALARGKSAAVKAFTRAVLTNLVLTDDEQVELMMAKNSDGMPGLLAAGWADSPRAADVFKEAVHGSDLSASQKALLLDPAASWMASATSTAGVS